MPTTGSERAEIHIVGQRPTEQEQSRAQALKARNPIPVKHRIPPFRGVAGEAILFNRGRPILLILLFQSNEKIKEKRFSQSITFARHNEKTLRRVNSKR